MGGRVACPCTGEAEILGKASDPLPHDRSIEGSWRREQEELRQRLVTSDEHDDWQLAATAGSTPVGLRLIGGCDISFIKGNEVDALAMLVILSFPELEQLYSVSAMIKLTAPYIPGFLAFREVPHLLGLLEKLKGERPDLFPQVIFVDGNGMLHPKEFGLACHLGVLAQVPTIGVGKNMLDVDGLADAWRKRRIAAGSHELLVGSTGKVWGAAVASQSSSNPTFISVGHRVSLATAIQLTHLVSRVRIPEPVRAADLSSREMLRQLERQWAQPLDLG